MAFNPVLTRRQAEMIGALFFPVMMTGWFYRRHGVTNPKLVCDLLMGFLGARADELLTQERKFILLELSRGKIK